MKKFYLIAAMAACMMGVNAQQKLMLSTYNGTNVEKFDGKVCNVTVNRYMFTGWNTIALPFDITTDELNEVFGNDCRLERLVGAANVGDDIQLSFQDCKAEGLKANMPYILYYTGEAANKKIAKEAVISTEVPVVSFVTRNGEMVTMAGVQQMTQGIGMYGILAKDNAEAQFTKVDGTLGGFYATRCCIQLSTGAAQKLVPRHLSAGEVTSIQAITVAGEKVDVFNVNGQRIASRMSAAEVNQLQPGIYVVKGRKILVK